MKLSLFLYCKSVLLLIAMSIASVKTLWSEFEWIGIENSKTGIFTTDLKVTRFNRTTFALSGPFELAQDLNDDYDCELKAYFSSKGNSQYALLPYKIPRDACCKHLESQYWKTVENRLADSSDVPKRNEKEPFCLIIKKGVYTLRQFAFDDKIIMKFLDTGSYKCEIIMFKKKTIEMSSMVTFSAKLY